MVNTGASRCVNRKSRLARRERCARSSRSSAGNSGTGARLAAVFDRHPLAIGTELPAHRDTYAESGTALVNESPALAGLSEGGRYWARTSDPQLVELVLSQLS